MKIIVWKRSAIYLYLKFKKDSIFMISKGILKILQVRVWLGILWVWSIHELHVFKCFLICVVFIIQRMFKWDVAQVHRTTSWSHWLIVYSQKQCFKYVEWICMWTLEDECWENAIFVYLLYRIWYSNIRTNHLLFNS